MMTFREARPSDRTALTTLWQEAFGDPVSFIDLFFESGFAPERSRVAEQDGTLCAMLYWFDCQLGEEKHAYIYAVATYKAFQGRGIANALMEDVHQHLENNGYDGAILSPGSESLFRFYGRMGYRTVGWIGEGEYTPSEPLAIRKISEAEYAALRRELLPANGVLQEGANLSYLSRFANLYAGEGFLAAVTQVSVAEFLGDRAKISGLLGALGMEKAAVRYPGKDRPMVMGLHFRKSDFPEISFGFPFD